MSKYDFELDLDTENSLSIIIDMIKPNSRILEFGPANGRLTRYLKECMNCIVDIVEIDEEAGLEAAKYANKYFIGHTLGNIENYLWLDELNNEKYDYIVFADVLEHLYWPEKVLIKCKNILKDDGSILISLPNIAHNSVIIDLINDEFRYNTLGLLDNTHIRFFTYHSLIRMLNSINLTTTTEKATYSRVGTNEIVNTYNSVNNEIAKALKQREKGNVYQFIFEVKKKEYCQSGDVLRSINLDKNNEYEFICYIKDENTNKYIEDKTIRKNISPGIMNEKINLKDYKNLDEIRIDPISTNCIIKITDIYTIKNGEKINLPIRYTNCEIDYENKYYFSTTDPQIYIETLNLSIEYLFLEYEFEDYDHKKIDYKIKQIKRLKKTEKKLLDREKELKETEKKLKQVERELLDKDKKLGEITYYLSSIESSKLWKITTKIKNIIKR